MADSDALRARRRRAHTRGDHSLCRRRCEAVRALQADAGVREAISLAGLPVEAVQAPDGARRPRLRLAGELLVPVVAEVVASLQLAPSDAAVALLAKRYAAAIDDADDPTRALEKLGSKLLAALTALQATPAARAKRRPVPGSGNPGGRPSRLEQLRAARPS